MEFIGVGQTNRAPARSLRARGHKPKLFFLCSMLEKTCLCFPISLHQLAFCKEFSSKEYLKLFRATDNLSAKTEQLFSTYMTYFIYTRTYTSTYRYTSIYTCVYVHIYIHVDIKNALRIATGNVLIFPCIFLLLAILTSDEKGESTLDVEKLISNQVFSTT